MQINGTNFNETRRPAQPPVDLEVGKPDARALATGGGVVLGALVIAAIGALAGAYAVTWWNKAGLIGGLFGGGVTLLASWFAWTLATTLINGLTKHQARVADWHEATLAAWQASSGQVVSQDYTEWSLRADSPRDVLLVALWVVWQQQRGASTPWSVRNLTEGGLFFGNETDDRYKLLGNVSKPDAEKLGALFQELGFVQARREGSAGRWVANDPLKVMETIARMR